MALEREDHAKKSTEVVEHFYSPVVEGLSLLSSITDPSENDFAKTDRDQFIEELSKDAKDFIESWGHKTDWGFSPLFNFLLPCPHFYEIELFNEKIANLGEVDFLFHFFSETIPLKQLEELVKDPSTLYSFEETIWWDSDQKRAFIIDFISNLANYRELISNLLTETAHSITFNKTVKNKKGLAEKSILDLKSLSMETLALAQYVMGKTFKRTSLYKMYYFIPSYYFTPYRMRIFNPEVCIVIHGCAAPLSDVRKTSVDLEIQLKALSDRNRLLILRMLSGHKEYGAKIAEYLGITTATVSHHLEILRKADLVKEEKVGTIKYFSYNKEQAESILHDIQSFLLQQK